MRNRNVLISGAGPAGTTLAYWLRRHGFRPTVVERAPAPRDGGQAVDVRGAAIEVAGRTGILDEFRRARTATRGMSYVSSTGKRLASLNAAFGVIDATDVEIIRGTWPASCTRPPATSSTSSAIPSLASASMPTRWRSPSNEPQHARSTW